MSELQPVSFRKGREHKPRLSTPYVPGRRSDRFWNDEDVEVVRKYFPLGGCAACLAHLGPHRTPSGVYRQARLLKLRAPKGTASDKTTKEKAAPPNLPPDFDDMLRKFYQEGDGKKRGECNAFADRLKIPRWWVTHRATKLGLTMPHKKEPPWTAAEELLMTRVPLHDVKKCSEIFRAHGFARSPTAIMVRAKRLDLKRRYNATFSATSAAKILGVDSKTVTREILQGDMPAVKRSTNRLPQQGGDPWSIERAGLRQYIIDKLDRVDFRKVDKFALVDVLVNGAPAEQRAAVPAAKKADGRKTSWTPARRAAQAKRMRKIKRKRR